MKLFYVLLLIPFISLAQPEMKTLSYSIEIEAPIEKVYAAVTEKSNFETWTSLFGEESTYEGDWIKGETMRFTSKGPNGQLQGLICKVAELRVNEMIYLQPYGLIENGVSFTEGLKVEGLDDNYEKYYFKTKGDVTELTVESRIRADVEDFFEQTWPAALNRIKGICEF